MDIFSYIDKPEELKSEKPIYQDVTRQEQIGDKREETEKRKLRLKEVKNGYEASNQEFKNYKLKLRFNDFQENKFRSVLQKHVKTLPADQLRKYDQVYEAQDNQTAEEKKVKLDLHASRGTSYALDNKEDTLTFDIGGSGSTEMQRFSACNLIAVGEDYPMKKRGFFGRIFSSVYNFFGRVTRLYDPVPTKEYDKIAAHNLAEYEKAYGKQVTLITNGKTKKFQHIRKKESVDKNGTVKTRYNLAGPLAAGGLLNFGEHATDKLEEYVLSLGSQWLAPKLAEMMNQPEEMWKDVHVMITGHSRGGVASSLAAMRLNQWIYDNYPESLAKRVKFNITLQDPVPGKGSRYGLRERMDINTQKSFDADGKEIKAGSKTKPKYRSLEGQQESTVIYCLRSGHSHFFTPQHVDGAKRIIISPVPHRYAMNPFVETDTNKNNTKKSKRKAYVDPNTMSAYRNSGLNDMPEGFYFSDENFTLYKVNSYEEYLGLKAKMIEGLEGSEKKRYNVLDNVAKEYFKRQGQKNG